jgi:hypothetical protein
MKLTFGVYGLVIVGGNNFLYEFKNAKLMKKKIFSSCSHARFSKMRKIGKTQIKKNPIPNF